MDWIRQVQVKVGLAGVPDPRNEMERRLKAYPKLVRDVNALLKTFLLPAKVKLTKKQRAALDNLAGTMMELDE